MSTNNRANFATKLWAHVEAWVFLFCVRLANMWSVPEVFLKFWFSWIDEYLKNGRPSGTADLVQWHQQNQIRIKISFRNYFHQIFCVCAIGWAVMALFTIFGNLEGSKLGRIIFKRIIFKIFWSEHVWLIWLDRTDGSLSQLPSSMYPTRDINPHLTHFFVNLFAWILQCLLFYEMMKIALVVPWIPRNQQTLCFSTQLSLGLIDLSIWLGWGDVYGLIWIDFHVTCIFWIVCMFWELYKWCDNVCCVCACWIVLCNTQI